ncbi:MAG TPA: NAD-dependent epimerase/dehydratase family protein, partial [Gemmatimonadaceae bacterium]|nr:NAD-dependent epimerase/dehydratase family protein [Gemmatimonadaceae bacterium]
MRIFVTGAASPLGQALTRILVREGHSVAGQIRRSAGIAVLRGLGAEPVMEDLLRPSSLIGVMEGCDLVFHLAHFFDFWAADSSTYLGVNIRGTEAVMTSALVADVQRVVFCSTALAAADPARAPLDGKRFAHANGSANGSANGNRHYITGSAVAGRRARPATTEFARSMQIAEEIALRYIAKGMEVVVARPSIVLAPNDPGWAGRLVADRVAGRRRFASRAPIGWIWVEDAARAIALAAGRGECGKSYTFSGTAASPRALLSRISHLAGASSSRPLPLPRAAALAMAAVGAPIARIERRRPALPLDEARFLSEGLPVDGS